MAIVGYGPVGQLVWPPCWAAPVRVAGDREAWPYVLPDAPRGALRSRGRPDPAERRLAGREPRRSSPADACTRGATPTGKDLMLRSTGPASARPSGGHDLQHVRPTRCSSPSSTGGPGPANGLAAARPGGRRYRRGRRTRPDHHPRRRGQRRPAPQRAAAHPQGGLRDRCDGANSFVRSPMGAPMHDLGFFFDWLIVDLVLHDGRVCDPPDMAAVRPGAADDDRARRARGGGAGS